MRNPIYFVIAIDSGKILPQDSIVRRAYALMPLAVEFIYQMVLPIKKKVHSTVSHYSSAKLERVFLRDAAVFQMHANHQNSARL